jgi:cytochrome c-type protein NapB
MKKSVTILMASLLTIVVGCASYEPIASMRGTDVAAPDKAPAPLAYKGARPGTQPKVERTFAQQPPVIPHALDNYDEVNLKENQCIDCHGPANAAKKNAPKLGDSHFADAKQTQYAPNRHNCNLCHVPQVDAPALVENKFSTK